MRKTISLSFLSLLVVSCIPLTSLLIPAANFAAEGVSVHKTGKTLTENLKDVINESKEEDENKYPIPPRKPTPPVKQLEITTPTTTVGDGI